MIQGLGAKMVGNFLGVREPETNGILVVGSNPVALLVATSLKDQGFDVIVAHNNYTNIASARMSGLRTYFGNPVSDHADHHLDLIGIGRLFAMSMDKELNTLSEIHYRHEFGERKLYRLKFSDEKVKSEREDKQANFHSQWLFNDATYTKLASMLSKKARIKITNITDSYTFEQYKADNKQFVPLYTVDKEGKLHVITDKFDGTVPRDRKLISLVVDDEVQPKPVDVTPKQEQARAIADASFESSSKAPEKRKETQLASASDAATELESASVADKEADKKTEQKTQASNAPNAAETQSKKTMPQAKDSKEAAVTKENKGVMSDNSTATSKTKSNSKNNGNGSGSAPKTKKGALDPNRLPDSSGDKVASNVTDNVDKEADSKTTTGNNANAVQTDLDKKDKTQE